MASITIRRLDDTVKAKLRMRAARHGRSMEEEAREILKASVSAQPAPKLDFAASIRRHIEPLGGMELTLPRRDAIRRPPKFAR
jgi:plasmid stability protein